MFSVLSSLCGVIPFRVTLFQRYSTSVDSHQLLPQFSGLLESLNYPFPVGRNVPTLAPCRPASATAPALTAPRLCSAASADRAHRVSAVFAVRRQGHHQRLVRRHRARLGRQLRRAGQHPDPPLRGRAPPAVRTWHDGHLLQGKSPGCGPSPLGCTNRHRTQIVRWGPTLAPSCDCARTIRRTEGVLLCIACSCVEPPCNPVFVK